MGRLNAMGLLESVLTAMPNGRNKVYASVKYPLLTRRDFAFRQAGRPIPPEQGLVSEPEFWALVDKAATEKNVKVVEVLAQMLDQWPDPNQNPPHPFLVAA